MKPALMMTGAIAAALFPAPAAAGPERDAVKAVIRAVEQGEDLGAAFPGAISARETASLRRVSRCAAPNLMKQPGGHYTMVWDCGSKGALGMRVELIDGKVTSISTIAIGIGPNTGSR